MRKIPRSRSCPSNSPLFSRVGSTSSTPRTTYREYTVRTPGEDDRGARRIVTSCAGPQYWTADHYESFSRITGARL